MKRGKIISLLSALLVGSTITTTGCSNTVVEHEHKWNDGEVFKEATCHSEGIKKFTCTVDGCDQEMTKPIAMLAHAWDNGSDTKQATCKAEGVKTYACTNDGCTATKEVVTEKAQHTYGQAVTVRAASLYEKGLEEKECSVCHNVVQNETKALAETCIHVWNSGEEIKEPTCKEEGSVTYTCTLCSATKTSYIAKSDHQYNDGVVTTPATKDHDGVLTYTCTECYHRETQKIPGGLMKVNYKDDFKLDGTSAWEYGYATDYDYGKETFIFHNDLTAGQWGWMNNDGLEIKDDWMCNESANKQATVRYTMPVDKKVNIKVNFTGENAETRVAGRIHIQRGDEVLKCEYKYDGTKDWSFEQEFDLQKGDIVSLIFGNEKFSDDNFGGYKKGNFTFEIEEVDTTFNKVNYKDDFKLDGTSVWEYGYATDYDWGNNTFTFHNDLTAGEYGWTNNDNLEIKGDWMCNESADKFATVRYTMPVDKKVNIKVTFTGEDAETRVAGRIHIQRGDKVLKCEYKYDGAKDWSFEQEFDLQKGDIVSLIFFNEKFSDDNYGGYKKGNFTIEIEGIDTTFNKVNYKDDFKMDGTSVWEYGYATDYNWDNNTFTFHNDLTAGEYGWTNNDNLEIKDDWMCNESADKFATVRYTMPVNKKVNIKVTFTGENAETRVAGRIHIQRGDEVLKCEYKYDGAKDWSFEQEFDLQKGDIVSVLFFNEKFSDDNYGGYKKGNFTIEIEGASLDSYPEEEPVEKVFVTEYDKDFKLDGTSVWEYGYATDYDWDNNTFTFHNDLTAGEYGWMNNDGLEIKGDWMCNESADKFATVRYTMTEAKLVNLIVTFTGENAETRVAGRVHVQRGNQVILLDFVYNGESKDWSYETQIMLHKGDIVSVLFFNEKFSDDNFGGYKKGNFTIQIENCDVTQEDGWDSTISFDQAVGGGYDEDVARGLYLSADEENAFRFAEKQGSEIYYSAKFTKADANAQKAGLVFGANADKTQYWSVLADMKNNTVTLYQTGVGELKTVTYNFNGQNTFFLTVVVNQGIVKVFVNNAKAACLICEVEDCQGQIGLNVDHSSFYVNDVQFGELVTVDGKFNLNGEAVVKVIDITNNNTKLENTDYIVEDGVIYISATYLKKQEANVDRIFNIVTDKTDYTYIVTNEFTPVTVRPLINKFYRGDEVVLEMDGTATVSAVTVNGQECNFSQENDKITLEVPDGINGKLEVNISTTNGKVKTTIEVREAMESLVEMEEKANHIFFWVDITIFVGLIGGYAVVSALSKRKK